MRHNRIRTAFSAFVLTASAATLVAAPASAQTPYDGLWQVTVVTKTGSCEPTTSSTLTVTDGKVSAGGAPAGSVGRERLVRGSINGAYAYGNLSGKPESGKRNGAPAGIPGKGYWETSRQ